MHLYFEIDDKEYKVYCFQRATEAIRKGTTAISELKKKVRKLRAEEKERRNGSVRG